MSDAMNELIDLTISANREKLAQEALVSIVKLALNFQQWRNNVEQIIQQEGKQD